MARRTPRIARASALLAVGLAVLAAADGSPRLEDPTRPPNLDGASITLPDPSEEVQAFKLTTILRARGRVFAVINGRRVEVGEEVDGAQVLAIEMDHVKIEADDGPVELRLGAPSLRRKPDGDPGRPEESP